VFAGWLIGEKGIRGFEGPFVVPFGGVNELVSVMCVACV